MSSDYQGPAYPGGPMPAWFPAAVWRARFIEKTEFVGIIINALYIITTIEEEVTLIGSQKWGFAKVLFKFVRYCPPLWGLLYMLRTHPLFITMTANSCKGLYIVTTVFKYLIPIACDTMIGVCISALLQTGTIGTVVVMLFCTVIPFMEFFLRVHAVIRYPADPVWFLDKEMGVPCYFASDGQLDTVSFISWELEERTYSQFAATIVILLLALYAIFMRYRHNRGKLIHIIRRDGGAYILIVSGLRLFEALLNTPAIMSNSEWGGFPAFTILDALKVSIYPILVQQLLINMRLVDYEGTKRPVASALLFASPPSDTDTTTDFEETKDTEAGGSSRKQEPGPEGVGAASSNDASGV